MPATSNRRWAWRAPPGAQSRHGQHVRSAAFPTHVEDQGQEHQTRAFRPQIAACRGIPLPVAGHGFHDQRSRGFSRTTRMRACPAANFPAAPTSSFQRAERSSLSTDASGTSTTAPPANTHRRQTRNSGRPSAPQHANGTNAPSMPSGCSVGSPWSCGNASSGTRKSFWIACRGSWDQRPVPPRHCRNLAKGP